MTTVSARPSRGTGFAVRRLSSGTLQVYRQAYQRSLEETAQGVAIIEADARGHDGLEWLERGAVRLGQARDWKARGAARSAAAGALAARLFAYAPIPALPLVALALASTPGVSACISVVVVLEALVVAAAPVAARLARGTTPNAAMLIPPVLLGVFAWWDFGATHGHRYGTDGGHALFAYLGLPVVAVYLLLVFPLLGLIVMTSADEIGGYVRHADLDAVMVLLTIAGAVEHRGRLKSSLQETKTDDAVIDKRFTSRVTVQLRWLAHTGRWLERSARAGVVETEAASSLSRTLSGYFERRRFDLRHSTDLSLIAGRLGTECSALARALLVGRWDDLEQVALQAGPAIRTSATERATEALLELEAALARMSSFIKSALGVLIVLLLIFALLGDRHGWITWLTAHLT